MWIYKNRAKDFWTLVLLGGVAVIASYLLQATFLTSAFLFLGLPCIYLLFKTKPKKKEAFAAVVVFGILYCFLMDYLAELNGAWAWKDSQLLFPHRILGVVSADAIIWTSLWVLLLVLFYEHMLEHDRRDVVSKKVWYVAGLGLVFIGIVLGLQLVAPAYLHITYSYFVLGLGTIPPFIYLLYARPFLLPKLLKAAVYFVPLYLIYEIVGRSLGQWDFPGQYVGLIQIDSITFPLEEFIFWILLSNMIVLGGYELFIDDGK